MLLLALMDATEALSTVAQLALGLVGFTGVVIALDRKPAEVSRTEAYRLNILIFSSSGAMFLALVPLGLGFFSLSEIYLWKISNLIHAMFAFGFSFWFVPNSQLIMRVAPEIFHLPVWRFFLIGYLLNGILQILAAIGVLQDGEVGIYLLGLIWLLFVSLVQFRRMLLIQQNKRNGD